MSIPSRSDGPPGATAGLSSSAVCQASGGTGVSPVLSGAGVIDSSSGATIMPLSVGLGKRELDGVWCLSGTFATLLTLFQISLGEEVAKQDSLLGEWEIVGMIYKGTPQDSGGVPFGWIKFEEGKFALSDARHRYGPELTCIIRRGEIDIVDKSFGMERLLKAIYHLRDGELQIIWHNEGGERPCHFNALQDTRLTLYVLKKVR